MTDLISCAVVLFDDTSTLIQEVGVRIEPIEYSKQRTKSCPPKTLLLLYKGSYNINPFQIWLSEKKERRSDSCPVLQPVS